MLLLISCEKEIDFKGKEDAPKIVLNAIINPDSCIKVFLSESLFFLSTNDEYKSLSDAKVYVWRNGEMVEELFFDGKMNYTGSFIPSIGDKIKITVEHSKYPFVESEETEIPAPVPLITIDTVDVKCYAVRYYDFYAGSYPNYTINTDTVYRVVTSSKVKITFHDPEKIKNYYRIFVGVNDKYSGEDDSYNKVYCYSNDLVFSNSNIGLANTSMYNEFDDLLFDGEKYTLTLCFYRERLYSIDEVDDYQYNIPDKRDIIVRLESICESNYKYYSSLSLLETMGYGFFTEPAQIYSNIRGGIGIVGAYSVSCSTIELPKWEEIDRSSYFGRSYDDWNEFGDMHDRYALGLIYAPDGSWWY